MSENLHSVDDLFRDALNDHEEETPGQVWDEIEQRLNEKGVVTINKKHRRIRWVAAASIMFTCALAIYTYYINEEKKDIVEKAKKTDAPIRKPASASTFIEKQTGENNNAKADDKPAERSKGDNISAGGREGVTEKQLPTNATSLSSPKVAAAKHATKESSVEVVEQIDLKSTSSESRVATEKKTDVTASKTERKIANPKQEHTLVVNHPTDTNHLDRSGQNVIDKNAKQSSVVSGKQNTSVDEEAFVDQELKAAVAIEDKRDVKQYDSATINSIGDKKLTPVTQPLAQEVGSLNSKTKTSKSILPKFSVTAFFSPDFISAKLKRDKPRFREDERNEIKRNEETKVSSTMGVLANYSVGNNWSLVSGLSYSTRITEITGKTIYARPDNRGNVKYRFNCSAGYTFVDIKSGNTSTSGDSLRSVSATNTLHYFNIPIGVEYNIPVGKLSFHPSLSISTNILTKGTIETVIATAAGNERSNIKDIQGLKSSYFNGALALVAQYKITDALAFSFMPTARFALSSINKDAPVKTTFNSIGLATGLTIKL